MRRLLIVVAVLSSSARSAAFQTYPFWWHDDTSVSGDNYIGLTIDTSLATSLPWHQYHLLSTSELTFAVERSIDTWNKYGAVSPNLFVAGAQSNLPKVGALDGINAINHNSCQNIIGATCGPEWTAAVTYQHWYYNPILADFHIEEADIIFVNNGFKFSSYNRFEEEVDASSFDRILTHELGHLYALGHPDENYNPLMLMGGEVPQPDLCPDTQNVDLPYGPIMCSHSNSVRTDVPLDDDIDGLQMRQAVRDGAVRFSYMNTNGGLNWEGTPHIIDPNWVTKYEPRIACNPTNGPTPDCAVSSISGTQNRITLSTVTGDVGQIGYRQASLTMNNSSVRSVDVAMRPRNNDGEI